jgi:hypothetical protein
LNAALIANGDVEEAERVWDEIDILRWEPRRIGAQATAYSLLFEPQIVAILSLLLGVVGLLSSSIGDLAHMFFQLSVVAALTTFWIGACVRLVALNRKPLIFLEPEVLMIIGLVTLIASIFVYSLLSYFLGWLHGHLPSATTSDPSTKDVWLAGRLTSLPNSIRGPVRLAGNGHSTVCPENGSAFLKCWHS